MRRVGDNSTNPRDAAGYRLPAPGWRLAAGHPDAAPAVVADAAALPFRDEAFGLVVAYMCLHDIDRMPAAVAEAPRVLEPGGRLCAAIPHPVNSAGRFSGRFSGRDADAPFLIERIPLSLHLRAVKRGELKP